MDWAKTTARRDERPLSFGIWCGWYWMIYGNVLQWYVQQHAWLVTINSFLAFGTGQQCSHIKPTECIITAYCLSISLTYYTYMSSVKEPVACVTTMRMFYGKCVTVAENYKVINYILGENLACKVIIRETPFYIYIQYIYIYSLYHQLFVRSYTYHVCSQVWYIKPEQTAMSIVVQRTSCVASCCPGKL